MIHCETLASEIQLITIPFPGMLCLTLLLLVTWLMGALFSEPFFYYYWSKIPLQYFISFCCTMK